MSKVKVTEGRTVTFTPSERTANNFHNKKKKTYPAVVTEVNEDSVDLTVFGVGEEVYAYKVKHSSEANEGRSKWDWPARAEEVDATDSAAPVVEEAAAEVEASEKEEE